MDKLFYDVEIFTKMLWLSLKMKIRNLSDTSTTILRAERVYRG